MTTKTTISAECQEWIDQQSREFMQPFADLFAAGDFDHEDGEPCEAGWYARLSAPGYMDCTEWSGPFDSEAEAMENLFDMFGE